MPACEPDAWARVKPFTTLRPAEEWPRILIVTRWDFEVLEEARDSQIVTYKLTGVYDLAEGYSAISASEQVQFVMHEHDGNLLITAITPDAPHLSARAALAWLRQRLNDAGTSDPERAYLRDAIAQIERHDCTRRTLIPFAIKNGREPMPRPSYLLRFNETLEGVLARLQHPRRNLLAGGNGVHRLALHQAPQNGHLGAQHVAIGNISHHLLRRLLHAGKGLRQVHIGDGHGRGAGRRTARANQLQRARTARNPWRTPR